MLPFGLSRSAALVLGVALLALLTLAGKRLAASGASTAPARAAPLRVAGDVSPSATSGARLVIHVVGAVRRPGLYRLADGARVADALRRAGGPTPKADLAAVNLAQPLADGVQVILPRRLPAGAPASPAGGSARVHLSTATPAELDELPGVGPVTAEKIVAWREAHGPFRTIDELDAIPGIGPARVEQLRELATP